MNKKKLLIATYLVVILFLVFVLTLVLPLFRKSLPEKTGVSPTDFPRQKFPFFKKSPSLSPSPTISAAPTIIEKLRIINILPEEDTTTRRLPITQIEVAFNLPVETNNFFYEVKPLVEAYLNQVNPNTILISPEVVWENGITTITILDKTFSKNGSFLDKPFTYRIYTDFPEDRPSGPDSD